MNKIKILIIGGLACLQSLSGMTKYAGKLDKKFIFGLAMNNSWTTITGNNQGSKYFYKPSLGTHLKVEYYFRPYLGLGIAAGFQQRGTGIFTEDLDQSLGNPDSAHRHRLRFNTLDFPFYIALRTPKDIFKGARLSLNIGGNFHRNFKTTDIFYSVEDGFHNRQNLTADFYKNSGISLYTAIGLDINAGSTLFQTQIIFNPGLNNVYNNPSVYGISVGKNRLFGLQLSFMY